MLRTALEFISSELNRYVKTKDPDNFGNIETTVLSSIMHPDGKIAFDDTEADNNHKIIVTLINLEEDRISDSQSYFTKKPDNNLQFINPNVNLNLVVLFSVFSKNYSTALRLLAYVISFFQSNMVFDNSKFPALNAAADANKPWQLIERLVTSLHTLTLEQENNLWSAVGAKSMPHVLYKIRAITFKDIAPQMEAPPITEIKITDN